ncbi:wax ester/triacylglycerol synthase family O-acyltransferase [Mycolicibacterium sp.]|uniref:wax ester/triacylglycerol synthase family O-acyltransferase n=1 Tax=Mycolicibacterium sp. TaxID=2320850 RepID=UPI001A27EE21|nr:wax ester/triacylglycerol synthase family O-acyltransferase [Mycolicibacterium sp.]MBJ7338129.1 wax ester/triacylglycerol synthase family O-acyltransferase [Mycolicibacterium sp.]
MHTERLSVLDAGFLEAEDSDDHVSLAIGALAILDGPPPPFAELMTLIAERVRRIPRCMQVVKSHQWDWSAPEWILDTAFNVEHHVRHTAVASPGDERALFGVVADLMERRLDRARPLWECWMIEGVADGKWAMLTKIHHCIADGISAGSILTQMCDGENTETFATDIRGSKQVPERRTGFVVPSLNPLHLIADSWHLSQSVARTAYRVTAGAAEIAAGIVSPAAPSLTGPVSDLRRYSAARVSLADLDAVRKRYEVTINDVALAAISDSFRMALLRRGRDPKRNSLRTLIPVSLRTADSLHEPDNRVSVMLPLLPVEEADPVQRLLTVHTRLMTAKSSGQRQAGGAVVAGSSYLPFALTAWTIRLLTKLPQRGVVTVATNVPGPRQRLRVMDREVVSLMPVPPIALQLRTGIAIMTYADELVFGLIGDFDADVGVEELAAGIDVGVQRLIDVSLVRPRSRRR